MSKDMGGSVDDVSFSYHMYGTDQGTVLLQASSDGGSSYTTTLWSKSGNQGNTWQTAQIGVTTIGFESLRFTYTSGYSYMGEQLHAFGINCGDRFYFPSLSSSSSSNQNIQYDPR